MQYVGLDRQIRKNNFNSILLLIAFPVLLLVMFYVFFFFINERSFDAANEYALRVLPFVLPVQGFGS
jgi:heat shock protein HtpX